MHAPATTRRPSPSFAGGGADGQGNVVDLARLGVCRPEISHDFPTGARHLVQRAKGFVATVVNGKVRLRDGVHTGALAGRVVRNEAAAG